MVQVIREACRVMKYFSNREYSPYDAMQSDRTYEDRMDREAAIVESKENACSQLYPEVVEKFIEILAELRQ